jgi:hypothetical protein
MAKARSGVQREGTRIQRIIIRLDLETNNHCGFNALGRVFKFYPF